MKRIYIYCLGLMACATASAQTVIETKSVLDAAEDTTQVVMISDIIERQELVSLRNNTNAHFSSVWGRNSFFNIGYTYSGTLEPQGKIPSGLAENDDLKNIESDWGVTLTLGHNYKLHKRPIANVAQFNIDWTFLNLNANHYKAKDAAKLYDSSLKDGNGNYYFPWNLEKYEFNFSWALGPSLTLAPFTYIDVPGLHYLKFNVYYHIGYEATLMYLNKDSKGKWDQHVLEGSNTTNEMRNSMKMQWGHGLTNTFGFSMSWKAIGLGLEWRNANVKNYKSIDTSYFSKDKSHFKSSQSRVYLTIRH